MASRDRDTSHGRPRVLFAGGGTGGHLYPAIAIADALHARGATIAFAGSADRLETRIVPEAGYPLHTITGRPLTRRLGFDTARTIGANAAGTLQSVALLRRARPDIVIATGGYVCFPVVIAARTLSLSRQRRCAIALLEPNARPGLTNRMLAPLVDEVWGAFGDDDSRFAGKYVRTGVPVRASLLSLPPRDAALAAFGLKPGLKTLLAMGGSQGARTINDALVAIAAAGRLPPGWQLLLVTGDRDFERVGAAMPTGVAVVPYVADPAAAYAAADLVIARAGASTLAELSAVGKPAILVPYPFAAGDHQTANATRYAQSGAAVVVADHDLGDDGLHAAIVAAAERVQTLQVAAAGLRGADPVATILARVDWLTARRDAA